MSSPRPSPPDGLENLPYVGASVTAWWKANLADPESASRLIKGFDKKPLIAMSEHIGVAAGRRLVVFVHGCFWHRHAAKTCKLARLPKTRLDFWLPKLEGNRKRDARNRRALARAGWKTLVVWECQLGNIDRMRNRIARFLRDTA